ERKFNLMNSIHGNNKLREAKISLATVKLKFRDTTSIVMMQLLHNNRASFYAEKSARNYWDHFCTYAVLPAAGRHGGLVLLRSQQRSSKLPKFRKSQCATGKPERQREYAG